MHFCVQLLALFILPPLSLAFLHDINYKEVCLGNEFSLLVGSSSSIVTFSPKSPPGPKRIILEKTVVKDPRFEWTRDRRLVLKEVTRSDAGRYSIMLYHEFASETVQLIVSECIRSYKVNYGENFHYRIPKDGFLLEFTPLGSPESEPVLLWNRTDPKMSQGGRGRITPHYGEMWVAQKVTPADQGNYTMRNKAGQLMSHSKLTVQGQTFNVTRFTKESVNLPLFVSVHNATLTFTPIRSRDDPKPRRGPVQLVRDGRVVDNDVHFLNRVFIEAMYGSKLHEVVITGLSTKHAGVYDIRDRDGNLVSSTILNVIDYWQISDKGRAILIPSGIFLSLVGLILFKKRYNCSLSKLICCLVGNNSPPANPLRTNVQDSSPGVHQPSGSYTHPQQPGTPRKWNPKASPAHTGYTPVAVGKPSNARAGNQGGTGLRDHTPAHPDPTTIGDSFDTELNNSFSLPGASDCLHTSKDCVQFQIKKDKDRRSKVKADFSTLPLDSETTEDSTVYTSDKLNFL